MTADRGDGLQRSSSLESSIGDNDCRQAWTVEVAASRSWSEAHDEKKTILAFFPSKASSSFTRILVGPATILASGQPGNLFFRRLFFALPGVTCEQDLPTNIESLPEACIYPRQAFQRLLLHLSPLWLEGPADTSRQTSMHRSFSILMYTIAV